MTGLAEARDREAARLAAHDYAAYHARRYAFLMARALEAAPPERDPAVLDIGPSPFTAQLREQYGRVTSLGFPLADPHCSPHCSPYGDERDMSGGHIPYDLGWAAEGRPIETAHHFDLVVFAEVLEHLTVPPEAVLPALAAVMRPGATLLLQTPNAAALFKRLELLFGRNPYEPLRISRDNPGHFREYTGAEIDAALRASGFEVVSHVFENYFPRPPVRGLRPGRRLLEALERRVPTLREGQTVVARRS